MIAGALALVSGSKWGRLALIAILGLFLLLMLVRSLMGAGAAKERGKIAAARVVAIRRKLEVDHEIRTMDRAGRRAEFDRWLRYGSGAG